jgi:hypothetical protein
LDVALVDENFSCSQAERLDFAFAKVFAALETLNLFIETRVSNRSRERTSRHVCGPLSRWSVCHERGDPGGGLFYFGAHCMSETAVRRATSFSL